MGLSTTQTLIANLGTRPSLRTRGVITRDALSLGLTSTLHKVFDNYSRLLREKWDFLTVTSALHRALPRDHGA